MRARNTKLRPRERGVAEAVADLEAAAARRRRVGERRRSAREPRARPWTITGTPPRETPCSWPLIVNARPTRGRRVETVRRRVGARLQRQVAVGAEAHVVGVREPGELEQPRGGGGRPWCGSVPSAAVVKRRARHDGGVAAQVAREQRRPGRRRSAGRRC